MSSPPSVSASRRHRHFGEGRGGEVHRLLEPAAQHRRRRAPSRTSARTLLTTHSVRRLDLRQTETRISAHRARLCLSRGSRVRGTDRSLPHRTEAPGVPTTSGALRVPAPQDPRGHLRQPGTSHGRPNTVLRGVTMTTSTPPTRILVGYTPNAEGVAALAAAHHRGPSAQRAPRRPQHREGWQLLRPGLRLGAEYRRRRDQPRQCWRSAHHLPAQQRPQRGREPARDRSQHPG